MWTQSMPSCFQRTQFQSRICCKSSWSTEKKAGLISGPWTSLRSDSSLLERCCRATLLTDQMRAKKKLILFGTLKSCVFLQEDFAWLRIYCSSFHWSKKLHC